MSKRLTKPPTPGTLPKDAKTEELCISFFDLSRFAAWASSEQDEKMAAFMQEFYVMSEAQLTPTGARIVKFIGDAALVVAPRDKAEAMILALAELSLKVRKRAAAYGLDTYFNTNVHFGSVVSGSFGPKGSERYDILGKAVNVAALLGRRGLTLSPQAFRCLSPNARKRFQKVTPPITYKFNF